MASIARRAGRVNALSTPGIPEKVFLEGYPIGRQDRNGNLVPAFPSLADTDFPFASIHAPGELEKPAGTGNNSGTDRE